MDRIDELTADRVRAAYKAAGHTVETLAEKSGIAYSTLKRRLHPHGRASFQMTELYRIAIALDLPLDALIPKQSEISDAA
ncbi:hypothetical protein GS445_07730 [Rhodococcus hoagii]|uniref:helix-turn-helix domain-containing protein n=1 Tax=Rhodococcus hoagii TaxID=43767 RepID=UPI0019827093|nr:helix-turn-helix transcriptional regulator [Prescottella equi]MBM4512191.1 hypothetical protein [Prescottella equi]MBM4515240.1 hypothetical protein [Prescottella equi]MBM4515469.1 hypothetical protein [Prescottella equi]MBM4548510.1 hypothetical protein [Prescottella equi]MBM4549558.1 hypothetical protein [Prescottella equi]